MQMDDESQRSAILDAMLQHVAFDGWSDEAFDAAIATTQVEAARARHLFPRGALDLAILFHCRGDDEMVTALQTADFSDLRYSEKVAEAIWLRLQAAEDKEIVRRGTSFFSLPHLAPEGAKLIWGTADRIWSALGDTSDDVNWYTKRATLSGVYGSVVLFWLGDTSEEHIATRAFIERRIENVMQFEKFKAKVNNNPTLKPIFGPLGKMLSGIKAPTGDVPTDLPGIWRN